MENKAILQKYIQAVWDNSDPEAAAQFLASDYQRHRSPTSEPLNADQQIQLIYDFQAAFPDIQIVVEEVIVEGDFLSFRSTMRGTHKGHFLGFPPTNKKVAFGLIDIYRFEEGKVVEQWGGPDIFDLWQQLSGF